MSEGESKNVEQPSPGVFLSGKELDFVIITEEDDGDVLGGVDWFVHGILSGVRYRQISPPETRANCFISRLGMSLLSP